MAVVGVNVSDDRKIALDYLKENKVTFPNVLDTSESARQAMRQFETLSGMSAVPMTYVIGRDGRVVEAWYGYEQGRADEALKKMGL